MLPVSTIEEAMRKLRKLGNVLRTELSRTGQITEQEHTAIKEAIRIQSMHRDKFMKEKAQIHRKEHKHRH
jgi:hypothetical protein